VLVTLCGPLVAGVLGAKAAGAGVVRPALRVLIGGSLAMAITAAVGRIAHVSGVQRPGRGRAERPCP
jgi:hypothetical protein